MVRKLRGVAERMRHVIGGPQVQPAVTKRFVPQILKSGALYFACVFGTGFLLGVIRTTWVVPYVGMRMAELGEMPLMFVAMLLTVRLLNRRFSTLHRTAGRLGVGLIALCFLLAAELGGVLWLRGLTLDEYFASRDPTAGTAYAGMLVLFAAMPVLVRPRS
jgi:hypothetical protein